MGTFRKEHGCCALLQHYIAFAVTEKEFQVLIVLRALFSFFGFDRTRITTALRTTTHLT